MIAHAIFFYFFSIIAILSAIMVVVSRNTVHAVFFLILDFISIGCLFIMVGAEFLGMMMLIVYVGAVAVLFLFVVMIMNVSEQKLSWFRGTRKSNHIPVGLVISFVILLELIVVVGGWKYKSSFLKTESLIFDKELTNTHLIGNVMYTEYIHLFQISGIILLLSMIGAIVLTYRKREGVKRQSYLTQITREREDSIKLVDVNFKEGVKIDD
ncbi:MAG: NADH:ubiquinone oxidoreductase subunit J [Candidatus Marinimicrobia bacterium]|nr:NADH:ubiquinone oxidoreductase subunit J [Candidatus Neomarinimicrobiota bacterium]RPG05924.1 MAG: NADH-quinone oxidoreductase subunit J [Pelagibacteraceae bacterium TMED247]|tara:strand:- start:3868 stop:4500 length:633 start_codon:yes stop_codon:yes gene_type:complete